MNALARLALFCSLAATLTAAGPILQVSSPDRTITFTAEEFAALPHLRLAAADPHNQTERTFSGVPVRELLARAGAPLGEKLRGPALQLAVIARAKDGYAVVYALAEFDEAFSARTLLLADAEDGKPLREAAAPFQIIAPGDKKGARWARLVTSLEIVAVGGPGRHFEHEKK